VLSDRIHAQRLSARQMSISWGPLTPGVKSIIIANGVVFLLQNLIRPLASWFPAVAAGSARPVSDLACRNLHVPPRGLFHLLFNMLALFMFGCASRGLGNEALRQYHPPSRPGAASWHSFLTDVLQHSHRGRIGAIHGILLATPSCSPATRSGSDDVSVEARYLVIVWGFVAFVSSLSGRRRRPHRTSGAPDGTGARPLDGFLRSSGRGRARITGSLRELYRRWRMKRLRKNSRPTTRSAPGRQRPQHGALIGFDNVPPRW
jgi:hypothetical protein